MEPPNENNNLDINDNDNEEILSNTTNDDEDNIQDIENMSQNDDYDDDYDNDNQDNNDDDNDDDNDDENDDDINDNTEISYNNNQNKKEDITKQNIYKNSLIFNDDLENNDSNEFLKKFDQEIKKDFISDFHQECLTKNLNEIKQLLNVIRDKDNIIIDELHKTIPILTKYEKTKILGIRLKQLNNGSLPYVKVKENILDNFIIAKIELKQKKLPFIIQRPLPNNTFEYWKLEDLEIL